MRWKPFWETVRSWELWPFWMRYVFISPVWVWYCLRSGSWWFFSSSNPTITFGGFEGEGKKEMYDLLPEGSYPKTVFVSPGTPFQEVKELVESHGFSYPFIVKPDVGMKGLLFRKIDHEAQLEVYNGMIPMEYIVQQLVTYPVEVSVFYYRFPNRPTGVITGFIQKDLLDVIGDGRRSILELMQAHPKAKHRLDELKLKHETQLDYIPKTGERYLLAHAANLNRGASFTNLAKEIDEDLLRVFDPLSHRAQFYYGRYDIKCNSIEELKQGKEYSILEFNGSGAEPNHVYNAGFSLLQANKEFLRHWKALFLISRFNHRKGIRYWSFLRGWRFLREAKRHLRVLEKYDREIPT